jgi:predicted phage-related endonuclease
VAAKTFKPWEPVSGTKTIRVAGGATTNPKKLTGSRLGAVLGVNKWKSPFEAWCEIVRVGELPFEGNKFTEAGIVIEPKLIEWCKENVTPHIVTPAQWFGKTTQEMGYDHFPDEPIFGGMWDGLALDAPLGKGKPIAVIEGKTSSRPQDWVEGVPASYDVQGLDYALLLGVNRVFYPVRFMEPDEYDHPELCECTDENTLLYESKVDESDIRAQLDEAQDWWARHVVGNVSPPFDEKRDKDILAVIRKSDVKVPGLPKVAKEALELEAQIAALKVEAGIPTLEKRLKEIKDTIIKPALMKQFRETDEVVASNGWQLKKTTPDTIDKEALEADGLLPKYTTVNVGYTLTKEKKAK